MESENDFSLLEMRYASITKKFYAGISLMLSFTVLAITMLVSLSDFPFEFFIASIVAVVMIFSAFVVLLENDKSRIMRESLANEIKSIMTEKHVDEIDAMIGHHERSARLVAEMYMATSAIIVIVSCASISMPEWVLASFPMAIIVTSPVMLYHSNMVNWLHRFKNFR